MKRNNNFHIAQGFRILFVNSIVLCFLLLIIEIIFRFIGIGYGSSPFEKSHIFHHVRPKNYSFKVHDPINNEFGGHIVYFDSNGYRYQPRNSFKKNRNSKLIAFLGDSFVEANQSPWDSSFIGILEHTFPNFTFKNYGIGSYSPSINFLQLKYHILRNEPQIPNIIIQVLYSNDVRGDIDLIRHARWNVNGELMALDGGDNNAFVSLLRTSYLFRYLRKCQLVLQYKINPKLSVEEKIINGQIEELPIFEGSISEEFIIQTAALCKKKGIKYYLTAIPSAFCHFTKNFSTDTFSRRVKESADCNQIDFIDIESAFIYQSFKTHEKLFFPIDLHLNNSGQRVMSESLAFILSFNKEN